MSANHPTKPNSKDGETLRHGPSIRLVQLVAGLSILKIAHDFNNELSFISSALRTLTGKSCRLKINQEKHELKQLSSNTTQSPFRGLANALLVQSLVFIKYPANIGLNL